jgi:pantetheine-phosphate adenylyltransferase
MKIGIYPGSFDPITRGHLDVIKKAMELCDKLYVVVAINEDKKHMYSIEDRTSIVLKAIGDIDIHDGKSIEVIQYSGVVSNLVNKIGANIMIRGIRDHIDLSYELNIEQFTKGTAKDILTVYFTAEAKNVYTSSSLIRQFIATGNVAKIEKLVPKGTFDYIVSISSEKINKKLAEQTDFITAGIFK